MRYPIWIYR